MEAPCQPERYCHRPSVATWLAPSPPGLLEIIEDEWSGAWDWPLVGASSVEKEDSALLRCAAEVAIVTSQDEDVLVDPQPVSDVEPARPPPRRRKKVAFGEAGPQPKGRANGEDSVLSEAFLKLISTAEARPPGTVAIVNSESSQRKSSFAKPGELRSSSQLFAVRQPPKPFVAGFHRRGLVTDHRVIGRVVPFELEENGSLQTAPLQSPLSSQIPVQRADNDPAGSHATKPSASPMHAARHEGKRDGGRSIDAGAALQHVLGSVSFRQPSLASPVGMAMLRASEARHGLIVIPAPRQAEHGPPTPAVAERTLDTAIKPEEAEEDDEIENVARPQVTDDGIQVDIPLEPKEVRRTVTLRLVNPKSVNLSNWDPAFRPSHKESAHLRYLEQARSRFPGALEATLRAGKEVARSHPLGRRARRHDLANRAST